MKTATIKLLISLMIILSIVACSSPEEKAEQYFQKGMELLEKDPAKAKLEFQNALQIKRNMTKAMYGLALVAEKQGDWKKTFGLLNKVLDQQPSHVEALIKTGQIFLAGESLENALDRCNKALAIEKDNPDALNLSAAIKLKMGDPQGAIAIANAVLKKDPGNQDAYTVLATERLAAKDGLKAVEYLDKALAKNDKNLAVYLIKINTLENLSKLNEAEETYKKTIVLFPATTDIRRNYAQFLVKYKRKDEAELQMRKIAELQPKNLQAKLDIVRFIIATKGAPAGKVELEKMVKADPKNYELAFSLANLYQIQKDSASEDRLLNEISHHAGDLPEGFKARTIIASKLIKIGKSDEAAKLLNDILKTDSGNEQALMLRAGIAMTAKNYDAAIIDLRAAIKESTDPSAPTFMLAKVHESTGAFALADEQYLLAFQASKFSAELGVPYAEFLLQRKQPERAEKVLEDVLQHDPKDTLTLRTLAQSKISRGDLVGAQALAEKLKQSGDQSTLPDEIAGIISASKNDYEGTLSAFKRAHETAPNQPQAMVAVVRTYLAVGKSKDAIEFVQSVLKANPNNTEAKLLLAQVYSTSGNVEMANNTFKAFIAAKPNDPVGYQQLALAQQRANNMAEAEKTIIKGLAAVPNDFGLQLVRAGLYEASGRFEDAIKSYEAMLKQRPDADVVANNLASLLTDHRSDKASANRAYVVASAFKNSEIPQFLDTYAWASYKAAKYEDAEQAIKAAIEKLPGEPIFQYHYGKILIAKNDKAQAKLALEKALTLAAKEPFEYKDDINTLLKSL